MSDISKEGQRELWSMIFGNQFRNFLCMNALHHCEKCGHENLIFSELFLKLGYKPLCKECIDKATSHNLDELMKVFKTHDDSNKFEWVDDNKHMRNKGDFGCRSCQQGAEDK